MRTHFCSLAIAFGLIVACSDGPTEPRPAPRTFIQPPLLQSISVVGSLIPGETIIFAALAQDTAFRMPSMSRYAMAVWSNRGELEQTFANSEACVDDEDRVYVCQSFRVYVDSGIAPEPIRTAAHNARARLVRSDWWPDSASFYAFGDLDDAMRALRRREGVSRVIPWYLDSIGISPDVFRRYATVTLRYEEGTPKPNDGIFTAAPSDSIFARVQRPDGAFATWTFTGWRY